MSYVSGWHIVDNIVCKGRLGPLRPLTGIIGAPVSCVGRNPGSVLSVLTIRVEKPSVARIVPIAFFCEEHLCLNCAR